jgi:hypothetical protein
VALRNGRTIFAGGRINWDEGQIRILLAGPSGETSTEIRRRATAVSKRAKRGAPMRTGTLRRSIHVNTRYPSQGAVADITADAPYSIPVEAGRSRVEARSGSALHWNGSFGGDKFSMWAGPVGATHFMRNALDEAAD